jgi:hypothetical protein
MRKILFAVLLTALLLTSCAAPDDGNTDPDPTPDEVITLTFEAASFSDWRLDAVDGSSTVGTVGNGNPGITLEVGRRYRIINVDSIVHPFALTNSITWGTDYLLSQGGTGSFAEDAEVNYEKNTDGFTFTLTRALAAELKSYICTAHTPMVGAVTVTGL